MSLGQDNLCSFASYAYNHYFPRLSGKGSRLLLPCEFCDVFFESAREVQPHNEEKHLSKKKREKETRSTASGRQRQYLCDICGKSYTQSSHLWQHLRFHQGEYEYEYEYQLQPLVSISSGCQV